MKNSFYSRHWHTNQSSIVRIPRSKYLLFHPYPFPYMSLTCESIVQWPWKSDHDERNLSSYSYEMALLYTGLFFKHTKLCSHTRSFSATIGSYALTRKNDFLLSIQIKILLVEAATRLRNKCTLVWQYDYLPSSFCPMRSSPWIL